MAKFQLAKLRLLLEWGFQVIPADAAAGVDKRGLFSWKRTEGFVNTQGKKKSLGIGHHFLGVCREIFMLFFIFYPHFLCHHHTVGAGIGMLLAGMLESGGAPCRIIPYFLGSFGGFFGCRFVVFPWHLRVGHEALPWS